jgi:hypothetical protein
MMVLLHPMTVPAMPLNVTVLLPLSVPKLLPLMVMVVPTGPEVGDKLVMLGGPEMLHTAVATALFA